MRMKAPPFDTDYSVISGLRIRLQMAYEAHIEKARIRLRYTDGAYACWLIRQGQVTVTLPERTLTGVPGTWVFLPAWCTRNQAFSADARILSIRFACLDEQHGQVPFSDGLPAVFPAAPHPELSASAEDLVALVQGVPVPAGPGPRRGRFRQHAALLRFMACWQERCAELGGHAEPPAMPDGRLGLARRVLEEHRGLRPVPYAELVRATQLSRVQIDRLFRKEHGCTPAGWLDRLMLERVEQLLEDPRRSLRSIVAVHGFTDETHLVRWYRRLVGITPGRRRREGAHD